MAMQPTRKRTGALSIPASSGEAGLNRYLSEIKKFPILAPEQEYMLAKRWTEHGDTDAAASTPALNSSNMRRGSSMRDCGSGPRTSRTSASRAAGSATPGGRCRRWPGS